MTTRLIIKGQPDEAVQHAAEHGIALSRYRQHPVFNETICDADDADGVKVRAWFGNPWTEAPYPVGTLLFFVEGVEPMTDSEDGGTVSVYPQKGGYVIGARPREA